MNDLPHQHHSGAHGGHSHDHGHGHSHAPRNFGAAFAIGIAINLAFVVLEVAFGVLGGSIALVADAGHNLGDVLGLFIAWGAQRAADKAPTARFTNGYGRASILGALANAILLLVTVGGIAWEAIERLLHPSPVASIVMIAVAALGIAINGATALLFAAGRKGDINIRGAFIHMAADAGVSAAVVVAGLIIMATGWQWIDPMASLLVCAVIIVTTWGLLRDSVAMSMDAVPRNIHPHEVRAYLERLPGVTNVHDLHIWSLSARRIALTCHLVMPAGHPGTRFVTDLAADMHARFGIDHTTVQIETDAATECRLAPLHSA